MHFAFTTPSVLASRPHRLTRSNCSLYPTKTTTTRTPLRRFAFMSAEETSTAEAEEPTTETDAATATATEPAAPTPAVKANGTKGILMLCLGNICRSPAAEAVMNRVLESRDLSSKYFVDSCGTGGGSPDWFKEDGFSHHVGSYPDVRMQYAAQQRGYDLDTTSRPLSKEDFDNFDFIIAMDESNIESVETARQYWGIEESKAKVVLMSEFSSDEEFRGKGVPDPYYSGQDGFDRALDLILDACNGFADSLVKA